LDSVKFHTRIAGASATDSIVIEIGFIKHEIGDYHSYEVITSDTITYTTADYASNVLEINQSFKRNENPIVPAMCTLQRDGSTYWYIIYMVYYYTAYNKRYGIPE
jgi:hypothetical protein